MNPQKQNETHSLVLTSLGILLQSSGIAITPSPSMRLSARAATFPRLGDFLKYIYKWGDALGVLGGTRVLHQGTRGSCGPQLGSLDAPKKSMGNTCEKVLLNLKIRSNMEPDMVPN